jgi:phosphoketolase
MSSFAAVLIPEELKRIDAYWRAANYLSGGQIYLRDNPLLKQSLGLEHIKPRLLGHEANLRNDTKLNAQASKPVLCIPADEESMIRSLVLGSGRE